MAAASREGPVAAAYTLARFERDWDEVLRAATAVPSPLNIAVAHQRLGNEARAIVIFDSIRVALEPLTSSQIDIPDRIADVRFETWDAADLLGDRLTTLGFAYAGLGRADQAIDVATRLVELAGVDWWEGQYRRDAAARILARAGMAEPAIDILELLADTPLNTTSHALRLSPDYDLIRNHPRFQALLANRR